MSHNGTYDVCNKHRNKTSQQASTVDQDLSMIKHLCMTQTPEEEFCFMKSLSPPPRRLCNQCRLSLIGSFSVCEQDYCTSCQPISPKLGVMIVPTNLKNWLTFGGDLVSDTDSGSLFHFPHIAKSGI